MSILFSSIQCSCENTWEFHKSVTKKEKHIKKNWHVNRGEKVKNEYVRITYFSLIVFYQQLLLSVIYVNENIAKAQPGFRSQVKVNQPCYYTSISIITRREFVQKLIW